jgi:hypothetical protein
MLADFTVLSADIMKFPVPEILKTRCEMNDYRRRNCLSTLILPPPQQRHHSRQQAVRLTAKT